MTSRTAAEVLGGMGVGDDGGHYKPKSSAPTMGYRSPNCDGLYTPVNPFQKDADDHGVPLIPKLPEQSRPGDLNPVVAICGECGRKVHQLEGYYCGNARCPLQGRVTMHSPISSAS